MVEEEIHKHTHRSVVEQNQEHRNRPAERWSVVYKGEKAMRCVSDKPFSNGAGATRYPKGEGREPFPKSHIL